MNFLFLPIFRGASVPLISIMELSETLKTCSRYNPSWFKCTAVSLQGNVFKELCLWLMDIMIHETTVRCCLQILNIKYAKKNLFSALLNCFVSRCFKYH